ncbi:pyridoxamine 5'-phosphate oxidase family protein [Nitrososphaera viennensis]|uniref:Pyridoxamine 5'-phosphate oxidase family protein n=2 Tax=Nitrososphaera viennensis TaxID=1034015 RepID=A0A977IF25_9ARCH|nr:pyridoxamine 5'-phosphate oxidase family protein [Nitrososphaera viennensis]AIC14912.1 putative Pyridoxamine 5'-phosphate oxidase [Nitrososphaera viennensis EN76]UVS69854.1 pyridoxamine 5'-phosphate oxidase family protein [Nitrososphaera viennensis]
MKIIHATPGMGAPMDEQELRNFLSASKQNCRLGTVDDLGDPNVHPVWFFYEPRSDKIYVNTNIDSRKIANVRRRNTVYFCIDDEVMPVKGVKGKGKAKISENPKDNLSIVEKIMTKYLGSVDHPTAKFILETVKSGKSVLLEITPSYFSTWDFGKS